jgi:hypothetical protein
MAQIVFDATCLVNIFSMRFKKLCEMNKIEFVYFSSWDIFSVWIAIFDKSNRDCLHQWFPTYGTLTPAGTRKILVMVENANKKELK